MLAIILIYIDLFLHKKMFKYNDYTDTFIIVNENDMHI